MWEVELVGQVEEWYLDVVESDPETAALIEQAIDRLAEAGPMLGPAAGGSDQAVSASQHEGASASVGRG